MRDGRKMAVIGVVCAAAVGVAGVGAYTLVGGGEGSESTALSGSGTDDKPESVPTGPPSAEEVRGTAEEFLTAWESGDTAAAAALTDDETPAAAALKGFAEDTGAKGLELTGTAPKGAEVPFTLAAEFSHEDVSADWDYESALTVVREKQTGEPRVEWKPSVLHPDLEKGGTIVTDAAGDPPIEAVDRNGEVLTKEEFPELAGVLADLRKRYADKTEGTPGVEVRLVSAGKGDAEESTTLHTLAEGTPGELVTTLDSGIQKAAAKSLEGKSKGSAVAVKPSTGEILAIANTPATGFNTALRGSLAPGSTWKVVSASMLIEKGLAKSSEQHPCPKYFTHGGWKFQNLDKFEIEGGTFAQSFAASCNTAFISQAPELKDDDLTKQAKDVFGIGLTWEVGVATFDGAVPVQSDAQMAASLIGQGAVRANPLNMASVAATVKAGAFHQPYLVSPEVDGRTLATASRALDPAVSAELRALMKTTATSGTAAEAMVSVGGDKGGKTGSAEVDSQKKPNAWFIGYSDDLAAAAVIPDSGHGGTNAGPVVADILNAG